MPDAKHIYVQSLQNTHAAEAQGLHQIELQLPSLGDYPEYRALLSGHLETRKNLLAAIETALEEVGSGKPAAREAVTSAVGTAGAAVHGVMPDATLKNLYAGYAFQGEMIASLTSLGVIAEAAGYAGHKSWIDAALHAEKTAAQAVEKIIGTVTQQFLAKQQG